MFPSRRSLLLAAACLLPLGCLGPSEAAAVDRGSSPPSLFSLLLNTSLWEFLADEQHWHERLQAEVLPAVLAAAPAHLLPHLTPDIPPGDLFQHAQMECTYCVRDLQCQMHFHSLLASFLATHFPALVPADAAAVATAQAQAAPHARDQALAPPPPRLGSSTRRHLQDLLVKELEGTLLPTVVGFLLRKQPWFALRASVEFASLWGWEWPAIGGLLGDAGYRPCWDQLAVLRSTVKDVSPEPCFAYLLNHGQLRPLWQHHLDFFFLQSDEHSRPWTVEGNLLLTNSPSEESPIQATNISWVLPTKVFRESDYLSTPAAPQWQRYEGAGFVAAGYVWYPQIVAVSENVTIGLRLWQEHLPPECASQTLTFSVRVGVPNDAGKDVEDWYIAFECRWPQDFDPHHTCSRRGALPLWRMLANKLPGFVVAKQELVLTMSVGLAAHAATSGSDAPVGPLGSQPRLFSGPSLRLGFKHAQRELWGQHGFPSRKLPKTSSDGADKQRMAAMVAASRRMPWVATAKSAGQAEPRRAHPSGLWQLLAVAQGRRVSHLQQHLPLLDSPEAWDGEEAEGAVVHGSHTANALVAAALVLVPLAGLQAVRAYRWLQARQQPRAHREQRRAFPVPSSSRRHKHQQQQQQQQYKHQQGRQPQQAGSQQAATSEGHGSSTVRTPGTHPPQLAQRGPASAPEPPPRDTAHWTAASSSAEVQPGRSASGDGNFTGLAGLPANTPPEAPLTGGPAAEKRQLRRRKRQARVKQQPRQQQQEEEEQQQGQQLQRPTADVAELAGPSVHQGVGPVPVAAAATATEEAEYAAGVEAAQLSLPQEGSAAAAPAVAAPALAAQLSREDVAADAPLGQEPGMLVSPDAALPAQQAATSAIGSATPTTAAHVGAAAADVAGMAAAAVTGPAAGSAAAGGAGAEEEHECVVCMEDQRSVVLVPCGHMVLCRRCADDLMQAAHPLCPLCRAPVALAQRVWGALG